VIIFLLDLRFLSLKDATVDLQNLCVSASAASSAPVIGSVSVLLVLAVRIFLFLSLNLFNWVDFF
jgi:hypothetical protein